MALHTLLLARPEMLSSSLLSFVLSQEPLGMERHPSGHSQGTGVLQQSFRVSLANCDPKQNT